MIACPVFKWVANAIHFIKDLALSISKKKNNWIKPIEFVSIVIFSSDVELLFTLVTVVSEVIHDYMSPQE